MAATRTSTHLYALCQLNRAAHAYPEDGTCKGQQLHAARRHSRSQSIRRGQTGRVSRRRLAGRRADNGRLSSVTWPLTASAINTCARNSKHSKKASAAPRVHARATVRKRLSHGARPQAQCTSCTRTADSCDNLVPGRASPRRPLLCSTVSSAMVGPMEEILRCMMCCNVVPRPVKSFLC